MNVVTFHHGPFRAGSSTFSSRGRLPGGRRASTLTPLFMISQVAVGEQRLANRVILILLHGQEVFFRVSLLPVARHGVGEG